MLTLTGGGVSESNWPVSTYMMGDEWTVRVKYYKPGASANGTNHDYLEGDIVFSLNESTGEVDGIGLYALDPAEGPYEITRDAGEG